jgi:hypothetical protein
VGDGMMRYQDPNWGLINPYCNLSNLTTSLEDINLSKVTYTDVKKLESKVRRVGPVDAYEKMTM